jgi:hypothetical protein
VKGLAHSPASERYREWHVTADLFAGCAGAKA